MHERVSEEHQIKLQHLKGVCVCVEEAEESCLRNQRGETYIFERYSCVCSTYLALLVEAAL